MSHTGTIHRTLALSEASDVYSGQSIKIFPSQLCLFLGLCYFILSLVSKQDANSSNQDSSYLPGLYTLLPLLVP